MPNDPTEKQIVAAGGIITDSGVTSGVFRPDASLRVVVIHRARYDDWGFPKGKADAGETTEQTALREVREETGLECRILTKIAESRYNVPKGRGELRSKLVHYYLLTPVGGTLAPIDSEVDEVVWLDTKQALDRLHYEVDRDLLRTLLETGVTI